MIAKLKLVSQCINNFKGLKVEICMCSDLSFWNTFKKNLFVKEQLFSSKEQFKSFIKQQPDVSIVHLVDIFDINYFFIKTEDYISMIGPYTPNIINSNNIKEVINKYDLDTDLSNDITSYYNSIPLINTEEVLLCAQTIVSSIYGTSDVPIKHEIKINQNIQGKDFSEYINLSASYIENTYNLEQLMMDKVIQGNSIKAKKLLREIISRMISKRNPSHIDYYSYRQTDAVICTLLRVSAIKAGVPAYPIHLIIEKHALSMRNVLSVNQLHSSFDKLVDDICNLIITYRCKDYSPIINNAINYILSNLNENLSLSHISDKLIVSPEYLSTLFKKELNMTLTEYIRNERLKQASILLTCTSLSIQQVSYEVGISDYNYFSKLFKKVYNMSPSEFRKKSR